MRLNLLYSGNAMKKNNIVTPGAHLCVIEEFIPGEGTYELRGSVRASVLGYVQHDLVSRVIKVKKIPLGTKVPSQGNIIHGLVVQTSDEVAIIKIMFDGLLNKLKHIYTGVLHISQASLKYIPTMYEAVRIGDLVKAKVLNNSIPYLLSIKDLRLGVILSRCSSCGHTLIKISDELLKCPICGTTEKRKISYDYLIKKQMKTK